MQLHVAEDLLAAIPARQAAPTAWGAVAAVGPPLEVIFAGDVDPTPVGAAAGVTPAVGDIVGLIRFGARWYVTHILEAA